MKHYLYCIFCGFILFAIFFTFTAGDLTAQILWEKYEGNPVLVPGASGTWNDYSLAPVSILFDCSTYHLWYGGHDGTYVRIGYATSPDGITWTPYAGNPILDVGTAGSWEDEWVYKPYVLFDGSTYHMWYTGWDGTNTRIGYATSPDRITWTKYAGNPIMDKGSAGSWESLGVESPCILFDDTIYRMWYNGWNGPNSFYIGYATSPDGINWTKYAGNPILFADPGDWDYNRVEAPDVLFDGNKYHMWYTGGSQLWAHRIGYVTSPDGMAWTKEENPVLTPSAGSWDSQWVGFSRVLWDTVTFQYKMWYGGSNGAWNGKIGYATAPFTINVPDDFETIQEAIDAAHDGNIVLVDEGTYYENINFRGKAITVASHFVMDGDTNHTNNTIIDGSQPSNPDSGSVVYLVSGEDTTSVVMGFTITNGTGTKIQFDNVWEVRDGGGIFCWNSGGRFVSNKIMNNSITHENFAVGGGFFAGYFGSEAYVILENNQINNNTLYAENGVTGGGVSLTCNGKLVNNVISYNSCIATENEAAGGGVRTGTASQYPRTVIIEGNKITHNFLNGKGTNSPYYFAARGGGLMNNYSKVLVLNNEISYNHLSETETGTGYGGGIYMWEADSSSVVSRNKIFHNNIDMETENYGGGMSLYFCDLSVTNNIISGNSAMYGGGLYFINSNSEIINNTIINNTVSNSGGGLYSAGLNPPVINTILWANEAPNGSQISGSFTVRYSDIQGGWSGEGNINADPQFADTLYHLSESSPCIGSGIDSVEIGGVWYYCPDNCFFGNPRPDPPGTNPDMGACESPLEEPFGIDPVGWSHLPNTYRLAQNYPNPFNPTTTIEFDLPKTSDVTLKIFNILGEEVATLVYKRLSAGSYSYEWSRPAGMASGVYLYRLSVGSLTGEAGEYVETRKMVLIK